ncbi:MAG: NUDIX domain-containing protein, partial [Alphaproteobacteria bacterium]|nr:NUDIX domain-containing protein [Alphaproteobacteria bacterium]MBU0859199.1 NUDIX domain-containing protein [Alphaproteobacteria bacterium]
MSKQRFKFVAAVAVVVERADGKILVQKRKGTFADGFYMLPTGHVDGGETTAEAMARELKEETGIEVFPGDLELFHMSHSAYDTTDELITFFFRTDNYHGEGVNQEPDKCSALEWVDPKKLPQPFLIHAAHAIRVMDDGMFEMASYPLKPRVNVLQLTALNQRTTAPKPPKLPGLE